MYYLDFDAVYSHIIREEYASLVRLLPNLANNISKNDAGAVSSLLLNNFYNEAFTNALSSVKARIPRVYSIANIVKYL
jgi:hypothetical protein